ncbi:MULTISPECIES: hypothetical protein [Pseudomonas]|uniref:hypothetical protein n=1 Tax=Pseudomonas TaxID=286 RepID=UPI001B5A16C1|nr:MULTISPECIES: hypothetical protein [unclassified Pseudomonas]MBP1126300.1 hypothetical protein [Pseudomonas sp. PvP025]MDQ0400159.1 hypothetical protein [Pseudomonas sp. PvP006]
MAKIGSSVSLVMPAFIPRPPAAPVVNTRSASFSGTRTGDNPVVKPRSASVNQRHASPAVKKNALGQTLNVQGKPINASGHLINEFNQRINAQGYAINDQHHLIDKQNRPVNKDQYLVDPVGRPLDKKGNVARSMETAVKGDVAPPVGQVTVSASNAFAKWKKKSAASKPAEGSQTLLTKNMAELTQRMMDAEKLVKTGVIPKSPGIKNVAAEAATNAAISGLVSAPISVGAYGASTSWGESIKASYLPIPLSPQAPGTKSIVDPSLVKAPKETGATKELDAETKALYSKMDSLQVAAFASTNTAMALQLGSFEKGWLPSTDWSADPLQRMTQLEELLDRSEAITCELAEKCEVFFKSYLPLKDAPEGAAGLSERVDTAQRRLQVIDKSQAGILEYFKSRTDVE